MLPKNFKYFKNFSFIIIYKENCGASKKKRSSENLISGVRTIAPGENWPRLGSDLGLGLELRLGLRGDFPRGQLSGHVWTIAPTKIAPTLTLLWY